MYRALTKLAATFLLVNVTGGVLVANYGLTTTAIFTTLALVLVAVAWSLTRQRSTSSVEESWKAKAVRVAMETLDNPDAKIQDKMRAAEILNKLHAV